MTKKRNITLKNKILNILLTNGNKPTGEKILLKTVKLIQKLTYKKHKELIQLAVVNSTPTFKMNQQKIKKGKRKSKKEIPTFIQNDLLRTAISLKYIKKSAKKIKNSSCFYKNFTDELFLSSKLKSQSIDKKNEIQKQILIHKKYLFKFRW